MTIRFCFAHQQQTYSLSTCLVGGWPRQSPCDVAEGEVIRIQPEEAA